MQLQATLSVDLTGAGMMAHGILCSGITERGDAVPRPSKKSPGAMAMTAEEIKEANRASARRFYEENKALCIARARENYHAKHAENRAQQKRHREEQIAADTTFRERENAASRERYAADPARHLLYRKKSLAKALQRDPELLSKYNHKSYWKDPEKSRAAGRIHAQNRIARKRGAAGAIDAADIQLLMERQKGKCAWCLKSFGDTWRTRPSVDHYQALARGGKHELANLRLLHRVCNMQKHAKDPLKFALQNGLLCW